MSTLPMVRPAFVVMLAFCFGADSFAEDGIEFFEAKIRPVLVRECYECHAADAKQVNGGLLLDHQAGLLKGGDSGPSVVPGKVEDSLLISALRHESFDMPPKGKLPDEVIADFVRWVEMGAPDPRREAKAKASQAMTLADAKNFWSFKPLSAVGIPSVINTRWPKNEIDHFVLAQLEANGLEPVRPATKREWIRRATFDLIGLPPTVAEIEAFLADESEVAYETVIDRLLDSPHYGERWGRHWLDVARYAEDQAHTFSVKPNTSGYRYRDWVIDAFNEDMPYDQFVKLQIAADQMELSETEQFKHLPALGFFGLGAQYYKNSDAAKAQADELDDRVDTLTRGFLGLTVSCARCHDHKYDPIPTQDYYSLAGVFQSCRLDDKPLVPEAEVAAYRESEQRLKKANEAVNAFLAAEKQSAREAQASRVADYLIALWRLGMPTSDASSSATVTAIAEELKLSESVLKHWLKPETSKQLRQSAVFKAWFEIYDSARTNAVPTAEIERQIVEAANDIQTQLTFAFDVRAGRHKPDVASKSDSPPIFENGKPRYSGSTVSKNNPVVDVNVDLKDAKELYLVITDAGDGRSCDHADWLQPRFITSAGDLKLTDLKWKAVHSGFGDVRVNKSQSGRPLKVGGITYDDGLGAHAPCIIVYDIPEGATHFASKAGLDNSGSDQGGCGEQATIQFRVYTERPNDFDLIMSGEVQPDHGVLSKEQSELISLVFSEKGLFQISDDNLAEILPADKMQQWEKLREELRSEQQSKRPMYAVAHVIADAKAMDLQVYIRGNPSRKGEVAPRRFLKVIAGDEPAPFKEGSGRRELAGAIASPDNPLTARVIVNRVWQQHFGRGIVATPSNFGALGERPTHPELLDYLALRFIQQGWSLKQLHREIMQSSTYALSCDHHSQNAETDADNRFLWRMNRRRLDIEAWRDSLLAVSGQLNYELYGPSTQLDSLDNTRRTLYGMVSRHELNSLLRLFDFPDANITSERRSNTTVPQQQLFVLNSRFMIQQAKAFAARTFANASTSREDSIKQAFVLIYGREATAAEIELGTRFLELPTSPDDKLTRAERYAQVLLGANEFTFID